MKKKDLIIASYINTDIQGNKVYLTFPYRATSSPISRIRRMSGRRIH